MARKSSEDIVDRRELEDAFSDVAIKSALSVEDRSDRERLDRFRDVSSSDRSLRDDSILRFADALERYAEVVARRSMREERVRGGRRFLRRDEIERSRDTTRREDLERVASDLGTALARLTQTVATDVVRAVAERRED